MVTAAMELKDAPWKKSYDLGSILKKRHYFADKGLSSQSYGLSSSHVWMWELDYKESWTAKIDAFELWCWKRLLTVPSTARRSNQYILKEISPKYSLEGLMLKLQYFGHLMHGTDSSEKTLMLGKIEGRKRGWQRMRWLDGINNSMNVEFEQALGVGDGHGSLACCSPWGRRVGHDWATELWLHYILSLEPGQETTMIDFIQYVTWN